MHVSKTQTLILGILADRASSRPANVGWVSPVEQDIYGPGATIIAKWASAETIDSPCFKLCIATPTRRSVSDRRRSPSTGGCGATVCPAVAESAGLYQAPVTVGDVPSRGQFYLQMEGDSGTKMRSPVFTLSPVGASAVGTTSSDSEPAAGIEPQAQAPLGTLPSPVAPLASPLYPGSPSIVAPSPPPSALNQASVVATYDPNALSAKSTPPAVAFAVPLSIVAAIILVAGGFFLKHRRGLGAQRAKDVEKLSRTGTASTYKSHASRGSEVDHALDVLCRHQRYRSPPFMSSEYTDTRPSKRAFPQPTYARWDPPAYAHYRDPPVYGADVCSSPSVLPSPYHDERPRLPPIASTGSFMSASDAVTHTVLADYTLPSPTPPSSTPTPRCLLPAPQKLHLRDDGSRSHLVDNPLGSPRSERDLYAQVAHNLSVYRRS
ncbi:hypothetical protein B0H17DRAFT_1212637 [Mycena rosella]|uniref:Uncharacterized protein n=1 Tax=Mycena rosella TaxID=1033263 RepID=A0AAD7CRJ0_MYCRO|nr:hypothetical protein B0H17DRAFT_1212637 [Mycena rosella]